MPLYAGDYSVYAYVLDSLICYQDQLMGIDLQLI